MVTGATRVLVRREVYVLVLAERAAKLAVVMSTIGVEERVSEVDLLRDCLLERGPGDSS